ncbi:hypothetical protein AWW66_26590 [Micromonospora rosaria]|uniref:CRISPR type III-associated protein domain-containing protein n=1 Tax=Micromonospora rosaria TaxID=47874 RepID=A0A136PKT8_9ACTN|nr:RAMP superfamily CRISPR-associated protein [Micromonospora rosaria]KXK59001.1 hypothetical protein AWW66_26590 [Micromonospora rosaria]
MPTNPPRWHDLELTFETPAFVGQPATHGPAPFPVASLRGVLRYWLRALVGAHLGSDLAALTRAETAVFGAAAGDDEGGPSRVLFRATRPVTYHAPEDARIWLPAGPDGQHLRYLLGQGLYNGKTKRLSRPFLAAGTTLPLRVRNLGGPAHQTLLLASLWALTTFGGIGARVRRGFGTTTLTSAELPACPPG